MELTEIKKKFNEQILAANRICILGHTGPDGDCAGSTLGLRNYIRNLKNMPKSLQKKVHQQDQNCMSDDKALAGEEANGAEETEQTVQVYLEAFSEKFSYLTGYDNVCHDPEDARTYDLCIVCDCADINRLGKFAHFMETAAHSFCIDHHVTNAGFAEFSRICPDASSTCEVLYDLLEKEYVDRAVAECIYTGIIHDTGVFRYSSTSPHTMEVAGECMRFGFNFGEIIDDSFFAMTFLQKQVLGSVLSNASEWMSGRLIFASIDAKTMESYGIGKKEMDGFIDQLRTTRGALCAVFMYQTKDRQYKVSLRSNSDRLDVAKVAQVFGGGGHVRAAGCFMSPDVNLNRKKIIAEVEKQIG